MSIKDTYNKIVKFDTQDRLEERLKTMMSKLTAKDNELNKQFKCMIYQGKRRGLLCNPKFV